MAHQALTDLTGDDNEQALQLALHEPLDSMASSKRQGISKSTAMAKHTQSTPAVHEKRQTSLLDMMQPRKPLQETQARLPREYSTSQPPSSSKFTSDSSTASTIHSKTQAKLLRHLEPHEIKERVEPKPMPLAFTRSHLTILQSSILDSSLKRQTILQEHIAAKRIKQEMDIVSSEDDGGLPSVQEILTVKKSGNLANTDGRQLLDSSRIPVDERFLDNEIDWNAAALTLPTVAFSPAATLNDDLQVVIAISRLSDRWGPSQGQEKLAGLDTRNGQLNEFAIKFHQRRHISCSCKPRHHKITLNGVSSNSFPTSDASYSHRWKELTDILTGLSSTANQSEVILTVSSSDGLFTNIYGFLTYFAPFLRLNLVYLVYEQACPKAYTISELFYAINDILQNHGGSDAHNLVRDWIRIGYAKMNQTLGMISVKSIVQHSRKKSAVGVEPKQSVRGSPATRVTRIVRAGGTDFRPQFNMQEEPRVERPKLNSLILCPTCPERFASLEELILHMVQKILALPEDRRRCPLCPHQYAQWTYIFVIDGIYHLFRHLSPANPYQVQGKRFCQCPYCFLLVGSASKFAEHLEHVHLRTLQVRHVAVTSGFVSTADAASIDAILLSDMAIRNRSEIMSLPDIFHPLAGMSASTQHRTLRWTTVTSPEDNHVPTGIPLPPVPPFAMATPNMSTVSSAPKFPSPTLPSVVASISTTPGAAPRSEIPTRGREMKYATPGTDTFSGLGVGLARRLKQLFLQVTADDLILCCLLDEWQVCGCEAHFESVTKLCEHIYDVLNLLAPVKRCCPWCPGQAIIFKPAKSGIVPGSHQSRRKANKPSDRSNDMRHLLGHFPPDI